MSRKKDTLLSAFSSIARRAKPSIAEVDLSGAQSAERVGLGGPRTDELSLVPVSLRSGLVELRKIEATKWKRYKAVLRTTILCIYKETAETDGAAAQVFELLKLMVKLTADDDVRMFYGGEWYEFRPAEGSKNEATAWHDAIQKQRSILYEQKTEVLSPRKGSLQAENAVELQLAVLTEARNKLIHSGTQRRALGDMFANVTDNVRQVKVDTLAKRIEVLSLEYHRSELECDVLSNNLSEYSSEAVDLMDKYQHLVAERARLSDALKASWKREEQQQKFQAECSQSLSEALKQISSEVLKLHSSGLSEAFQELQREKQSLTADVDEPRVAQLNRAVTRLREILAASSPCFAQESLLQRRVFELQAVIDELERDNATLTKLVESKADFELDLAMELEEPARVTTKVLEAWHDLAELSENGIRVWMGSEQSPTGSGNVVTAGTQGEVTSPRRLMVRTTASPGPSGARTSATNAVSITGGEKAPGEEAPVRPGKIKLKPQVFLESLNETEQLIRQVDAKVSRLRQRVGELSSLQQQPSQIDLAASSASVSHALSSMAGGIPSTRMARSATVGDLREGSYTPSGNSGSSSSPALCDVEYEKLDSFSNRPSVKSATTDRLISMMITQEVDAELRRAVLLTYRLYLSPADLLGRLMLNYTRTPDYDSEKMYLKMFALLEPVRTGVVETVAVWARLHPMDFTIDTVRALLQKFLQLLRDTRVDQKVIDGFNSLLDMPVRPTPRAADGETIDFGGSMMSLLNIPHEQIASQMTLIEFGHYKHVQAVELHRISKGFSNSPNVVLTTAFFNRACRFFVSQILREKLYDPETVAQSIAGVISIGNCCKALNNWDGVMITVAVLNTSSIARLTDAWALLSKEDQKRADELNEMTKKNFKPLRACMTFSPSPSIPHIALFVRDLTSLDESPTYIVSNGHVNYFKIRTMAQIIWQVLRHRDTPYQQLSSFKRIQDWILHAECLTDDEAYQRSTSYKPVGQSSLMSQSQTIGNTLGGSRRKAARKSVAM